MPHDERTAIQQELDTVRKQNRGLLAPGAVIRFAENPATALHEKFEWDNTKCGQEYRLWQARELIRVYVVVLKKDAPPVRAYVSLQRDRVKPGGGYRAIANVMRSPTLRDELLREALAELNRWRAKYANLKALEPIFAAMQSVEKSVVQEEVA